MPLLLAVVVTVEIVVSQPKGAVAALVLELAACAALVARRRWTLPACLVSGWLVVAPPWVGPEIDELAAPILVMAVVAYSLARWLPDHRGLAVLGLVALLLTGVYLFTDERDNNVSDVFFVLSLLAPPYVLGRVTRKLATQAEQLEKQQELVKREAVRAERDRIARELHDVIAHSVSAMVVQTAAAQDLVRSDPARAESVLADVAATGRRALAETGQLLHVLRDEDDELGLAPTPGLADVARLVEEFRRDGLDVRADFSAFAAELPAALDVSSYRIVQEALTNALRYAPDRQVDLEVAASLDRLVIRVTNRMPTGGPEAGRQGSGLGLLGLAERVSLLGGSLTHGHRAGRFELAADLPIEAAR